MGATTIEWTDVTWNPVRGCSVISPGCVNCYAMKQAHRFSGPGGAYERLTKLTNAGPQWTGDLMLAGDQILKPLTWRSSKRVFVNSMSDLFHERLPEDAIARVFAVMRGAERQTFQVLTKRADRMQALLSSEAFLDRVDEASEDICGEQGWCHLHDERPWPLSNVWLGVSVENQGCADARIPHLLRTPAAIRFVSAEPLLGRIDLVDSGQGTSWLTCHQACNGKSESTCLTHEATDGRECFCGIDWVIVGGESGAGARPFDIAWARSIVKQCAHAGVPCFVKQLGSRPFGSDDLYRFDSYLQWVQKSRSWLGGISGGGMKYKQPERAVCVDRLGRVCRMGRDFIRAKDEGAFPVTAFAELRLTDKKGGDPAEWPETFPRDLPTAVPV